MNSEKHKINSILIVDDDGDALEEYGFFLKKEFDSKVLTTKYPTQALQYANENLFDIILIDITINYHGSPFGGIELYRNLTGRYGESSLIAYSKFITDDLLRQYGQKFNFIEKGEGSKRFFGKLSKLIISSKSHQKVFLAMPFDKKYDAIYEVLKNCVEKFHYRCIRLDHQNFNQSIIKKIFEEIMECKFLIFLATDKSPNAFYECGYAVALSKEVITVTDHYQNLPFNVRDRNSIAYGKDLKKLEKLVISKLSCLTEVDIVAV